MRPKRHSEPMTLEFVEERVETERAYLLVMATGEEVWFPKSQVKIDWDKGTVTMPRWMAEAKELLPPDETAPTKHRLQ